MQILPPHTKRSVSNAVKTGACTLLLGVSLGVSGQPEPCEQYDALKRPLFGDLHIHTRYSFDSFLSNQRNDPDGAYRYAQGEPITLPDPFGDQTVIGRIDRPLDFAAVTDHGEFLGEVALCSNDPGSLAYWWPNCIMSRTQSLWVQLISASWWTSLGGMTTSAIPERSGVCGWRDCQAAAADIWQETQRAAQDHYDQGTDCRFTTFVGYEYTQGPGGNNMHRNVIFRNAEVTDAPISLYDTAGDVPKLWQALREQCLDAEGDCDVLAIPHNPNLGGGLMFPDPQTEQEALDRLALEPLVELVQHKGASECRFDRLLGSGVGTEDELCDFEQIPSDNLHMLGTVEGKMRSEQGVMVANADFSPRNMMRNVLKDGLALGESSGINPFKQGFIGSTDTHTATSGGAQEFDYVGHLGSRDAGFRNVQDHFFSNPGGLAVVWAEQNRRDEIFDGMRRRETYATSGTRPTVRFFGGALPENLCESPEAIAQAYAHGVPMGAELEASTDSPHFLVMASKDPGSPAAIGNGIERIQVIKGWLDEKGQSHEKVYTLAGEIEPGLGVDPESCASTHRGHSQLCSQWQDPDYQADQPAFYYARILETPSCRWSTLQCQAAGVNPFDAQCAIQAAAANAAAHDAGATGPVYDNCCRAVESEAFYSPVINERAWTSPIWVTPPR